MLLLATFKNWRSSALSLSKTLVTLTQDQDGDESREPLAMVKKELLALAA